MARSNKSLSTLREAPFEGNIFLETAWQALVTALTEKGGNVARTWVKYLNELSQEDLQLFLVHLGQDPDHPVLPPAMSKKMSKKLKGQIGRFRGAVNFALDERGGLIESKIDDVKVSPVSADSIVIGGADISTMKDDEVLQVMADALRHLELSCIDRLMDALRAVGKPAIVLSSLRGNGSDKVPQPVMRALGRGHSRRAILDVFSKI